MKKNYKQPQTETMSINTYELMQDLVIPVSGGTTPEESDAKQGFFDEDESWGVKPKNLWDD